jgi:phosphoserine phosphatase
VTGRKRRRHGPDDDHPVASRPDGDHPVAIVRRRCGEPEPAHHASSHVAPRLRAAHCAHRVAAAVPQPYAAAVRWSIGVWADREAVSDGGTVLTMAPPVVVSDMDGTLATVDTWRGVQAWILEHHPSPAARRFVTVRLPSVMLAKAGLADKEAFRAGWLVDQARLLAGLPEARLGEMGEWVAEHHLWPVRRQAGIDAVAAAANLARATHAGARLILATGAYQPIGDAFARRIGADLALGTPLVVRDGVVTGELGMTVQAGEAKAAAVLAVAHGGDILAAFGDTVADIPLLRTAIRAVAVAPDRALRREALARGWEIIEAERA